MYGSYANQKYNPNFNGLVIRSIPLRDEFNEYGNAFEAAFVVACSTANLYLNCVVSYEILLLLRHSDHFVTHTPPSLSRVTLQAVGVYSFSVIVFFIHYFVERRSFKAEKQSYLTYSDNHLNKHDRLSLANLGWSLIVTYAFPIVFFFYIWITIKCNGFMPSVTEKTKQLVCIFLRFVSFSLHVTRHFVILEDTHESNFSCLSITKFVGVVLFTYCLCVLSYLASWNGVCSHWMFSFSVSTIFIYTSWTAILWNPANYICMYGNDERWYKEIYCKISKSILYTYYATIRNRRRNKDWN